MRKGLSIALFIAAVLGAFLSVLAQEPVADILAAATAAAQRYPHADAVYLRSDETVKIDPAGNIRDTVHYTLLLSTQEGVDYYGFPVWKQYLPSVQTASLDYARAITMDGKVIKPDPSDIYTGPYPVSSPMIPRSESDFYECKVDIPNIGPHTVIDYQFTVSGKFYYSPLPFDQVWYLSDYIPTEEYTVKVTLPRDRPARWKVVGAQIAPTIQTESTTVSYTFCARDLPAVPTDLPGMPDFFAISPKIFFSTVLSWNQIASVLRPRIAAAAVADDWINREVRDQTFHASTDMDKIKALYSYVQQHISNDGVVDHLWPYPAATTFAYKKGVCIDQAVLLITMLRAAGIECYPAYIDADLGDDIDFSLPPTAGLFNHMIVAVPRGHNWLFLDPTLGKDCAFGCLPREDSGKHAMIVTGGPPNGWQEAVTPAHSPDNNYISMNIQLTLSDTGTVTAAATATLVGSAAMSVRDDFIQEGNTYANLEPRESDDFVFGQPPGMRLVSFSATFAPAPFPPRDPITNNVKLTATGGIQTSGRERYFFVPYIPPIPSPRALEQTLPARDRTYPYILSPEKYAQRISITLPPGMSVTLPSGMTFTTDIGSFVSRYAMTSDGKIEVDRTLQIDKSIIAPAEFCALTALYNAALTDSQSRIVITGEKGE